MHSECWLVSYYIHLKNFIINIKKPNQIGWATAFLTTEIATEIVAK
jgi:hypothetical protein